MSYLTIRDHPPCQENLWAAPESHRHSPPTVLIVFLENFPELGQFFTKSLCHLGVWGQIKINLVRGPLLKSAPWIP